MRTPLLLVAILIAGCKDKSIGLGGGSPDDARLIADLYTWTCEGGDTGSIDDNYEGAFSYEVSLEYAPDGLVNRDLPSDGSCSIGLDLFPADAGASAVDLSDADPTWSNGDEGGALDRSSTGFYADDVFQNQRTCKSAEELLGEGTTLADAGVFSGATTPSPETYDGVDVSNYDEVAGLTFGDEVDVSWRAEGWDATWLQIRRESGGSLQEAVTCNATGQETYTIDDDVWSLFNAYIEADVTNLYVGVQKSKVVEGSDGQKIETITRVMHSLVVDD
ncbi:MAG: hypothetical protein ACOZNI_24920 [Myxococcota bacterium]